MTLISRFIVVFIAFVASSITAGIVITVGVLVNESDDLFAFADPSVIWWMAGFFVFMVASVAVIPALVLIVAAESFGVRSVLVYAGVGGLGLVAFYYGFGYANRTGALSGLREAEIMAGAGIAAGFVYWAIAGRTAGAWARRKAENEQRAPLVPAKAGPRGRYGALDSRLRGNERRMPKRDE